MVNKMSEHKHYLSDIISDMDEKLERATAKLKITGRWRLTLVGALVVVLVAALLIGQMMAPKRSVAEYCKVYKEEKTRLAKLTGDTYPSLLFDHPLSDANEFVVSLDRLDKVSPSGITPGIHNLKLLYQKLRDDPSQLLSVSVAAEPIDKSVSEWTNQRCGN